MNLPKLNRKYPNKRAIITGANSGLGMEMLKILLVNGWKVLAIDLRVEKLMELDKEHQVLTVNQLDVSHSAELKHSIIGFCQSQGGIDILFNNAGVGEGVRFKDYTLENWNWMIDINLKAVIAGCYHVFPRMQEQGSGLIVNIASAAGYANLPNMSPYNVTKAGVISLSESLAHEFKPHNVRLICVMPTFFQSGILNHSRGTDDVLESAARVVSNANLNSQKAARIILSQLHRPIEVLRFPFSAKAIFFARYSLSGIYKWAVRRFLVK